MSYDLSSITTGATERPPRILLCGVEKIGKSTFAAGAPAPIFIPINGEEGIDDLNVSKFPTCTSYDDLMSAFESLYTEDHDFATIVIDSVSTLEPLIWESVCADYDVNSIEKVGGGFGKGYIEAGKKWREIMQALDALRLKGMGSILIGHVTVKTFVDPTSESYDQYQLDLNKHAINALLRWSDCILFANAKLIIKKEEIGVGKKTKRAVHRDDRCLFTQKRPSHPGGGRGVYGHIPYELPLTWEAFETAVETTKKGA